MNKNMTLKEMRSLLTAPEVRAGDLMRCALGIRTTEIEAYCSLVSGGPASVQEAARRLGKSRSTVQRLLQGLVEKGLAVREERLIGLGGYRYIYSAVPPEEMREAIAEMLDRWYRRMLRELEDLPRKIEEMGRCTDRGGSAAG